MPKISLLPAGNAVQAGDVAAAVRAGATKKVTLGTAAGVDYDIDTTLAANSDSRVPTQKAIKAYVDLAVTGLLDFKGGTDASGNPNYPAALKGDAYVVTVAGKIGGAAGKSVEVGDMYVASADNAGGTEAAVGASWLVLEHNLAGALLAANNLADVLDAAQARTNLGLGTLATQNASAVAVTGGAIDGATIGGVTPALITGTTVTATQFAVAANTGSTASISLASNNSNGVFANSAVLKLGINTTLSWGTSGNPNTVDLSLGRDGAADILALKRSTNAQTLRLYNTFTDASNYERATIGYSGTSLIIGHEHAGTGATRSVLYRGNQHFFQTAAGSTRWNVDSSGHLMGGVDNNYDIGAAGATRPRNIYAGSAIQAGTRFNLPSYTVATLPSAAGAGGFIYVSDESGGAVPASSDNTNWRRVTDRAVVS